MSGWQLPRPRSPEASGPDPWPASDHEGTEAPGAPTSPAPDRDDDALAFRSRHARLGVALSFAGVAELLLYVLTGAVGPRLVLAGLSLTAAVGTVGLWLVLPVVARHRRHRMIFFGWSLTLVAFMLAAASLDGGTSSPVALTLFLPLVFAAVGYEPPSVVALGIVEVIGLLVVAAASGTAGTAYTTMFATTLGLATWMAAQSARNRERQRCELRTLADRLAEAATHDDLTGCLNRRGFYRVLDDETVRARRYGRPLSLLLIDVDHLKLINDENGHAAGDRALLRVVDVLTSVARRSDVVARLGGDEFALLAPETTAAAATRLARRVHGELRRAEADHDVSVSIGVSAVSDGGASFDLMESADDALHAAKRAGRNRTAFASVSSAAPPASRPRADAG